MLLVGWIVVVFLVAEYAQMDAEAEGFLYQLVYR